MNGGPSDTIVDYRGHLSVLEHDPQPRPVRPRPGLVQSEAELVEEGRGVRLGKELERRTEKLCRLQGYEAYRND